MSDITNADTWTSGSSGQKEPAGSIARRGLLAGGAAALAGLATGATESAAQPGQMGSGSTELRGQVALVTGAARGIGRACAVALARAGADIAAVDIARDIQGHPIPLATAEDLAETVRLIEAEGRRALSIRADVRDMAQMRAATERAVRELSRVDVLLANAGINAPTPLVREAGEEGDRCWRNVIDVNVLGTANSIRAVLPHMASRKQGRIIAVTSTFGRQGNAGNANYVASKWAVIGLVKAAAIEAGPTGITVNAVAPTGVRTGLGGPQTQTAEARAKADEFFRTSYHYLPVGALEPEDIGGAVVFLASPGGRYISGAVIDVAAGANARYTG